MVWNRRESTSPSNFRYDAATDEPLRPTLNSASPDADPLPCTYMLASAAPGATGSLPLAYAHGWFLAQLPSRSSTLDELPPGGPFVVVGYDTRGAVVERLDLQQVYGLRSVRRN